MMNRIGKGLVLIHTAISILALSWAAGLFLQFTDWGWKEPRTDLGQRVPSEYDKRVAAFKEAVKARDLSLPGLVPARVSLRKAEDRFPQNHLDYKKELTRLEKSPDPIDVKYIKRAGAIVLDVPVIGKPVQEEKVNGIAKSYVSYIADLKKINQDIDIQTKEILDWTNKAQGITFLLTGKDILDKDVKNYKGIYALLEVEKQAQDQAKFEKEYLQPIWARAIEESDILSDRRGRLQETLDKFAKGKK
jgi:hypothetical protein